MNQSIICLSLNRKGLSAQIIHDKLVQVLGFDVIAHSTVNSYLRASGCRSQNAERNSRPSGSYGQRNSLSPWWNPVRIGARTRKVHVHSTYNSLKMPGRVLGTHCQTFTLCPPSPHIYTTTNSSRSIKRIAQTLGVRTRQQLAKSYNLGWAMILFVNESWNFLSSSRPVISWKGETYDWGPQNDGHNHLKSTRFRSYRSASKRSKI
jgi:hypothetical protein